MELIYQKKFTLTDLHVDPFLRLKPSVLLYLVQEVAADHAGALGSGWEELQEKQLFWAVLRHHVQITRLPVCGETITVETWPQPATRAAYPRSTIAYDGQGQELFRTTALWVLMDTRTRAMVLPGKSGVDVPGTLRGLEAKAPGSIPPKALPNQCRKPVTYSLLDRNGHMNNTRYLDWVDELMESAFHRDHPIREISLCYLSEARENQLLTVNWGLTEAALLDVDIHRAKAEDPDKEERVFAAQIHF